MSWGEIYNTSWWGIALDTARTVKARPDFFGSQLNLLTSEQPNLVVNGGFDTDSDWTKGTGWSIEDGKATRTAQSGPTSCYQSISFTANKTYKIKYDLDISDGSFRIIIGGGTLIDTPVRTTSGTYTEYIVANSGNNVLNLRASDGAFTGSIDNVSVQVARAELDQIEAKKCLADWIHTTALKDLNN